MVLEIDEENLFKILRLMILIEQSLNTTQQPNILHVFIEKFYTEPVPDFLLSGPISWRIITERIKSAYNT